MRPLALAALVLLGGCRDEDLCVRTVSATCTCELPLELVHCTASVEVLGCGQDAAEVDPCALEPCCFPTTTRDASPAVDAAVDAQPDATPLVDALCAEALCRDAGPADGPQPDAARDMTPLDASDGGAPRG